MGNEHTIICGSSKEARWVREEMEHATTVGYDWVEVKDDVAANCVFANNVLICRAFVECPDSGRRLRERFSGAKLLMVNSDELVKVNGLLTCQSLLY